MLRHQNVPQLTSVSDAPPLCMRNAQTETRSRGVRGPFTIPMYTSLRLSGCQLPAVMNVHGNVEPQVTPHGAFSLAA